MDNRSTLFGGGGQCDVMRCDVMGDVWIWGIDSWIGVWQFGLAC